MDSDAPPADPAATLAAWRAQGAHRVDAVRFDVIEALARRAARHGGAARAVLDARLAELLAAYAGRVQAAAAAADGCERPAGDSAAPSALSGLLERLSAGRRLAAGDDPAELKALRSFRSTWSRLSAERRLAQSHALVPEQAGPLNSQRLLHRALGAMRASSPAYFERFVAYVDALGWLDEVNGRTASAGQDVLAPAGAGKQRTPRKRTTRR